MPTRDGARCRGTRSRGVRASISGCSSTASTASLRASTRSCEIPTSSAAQKGDAVGLSLAAPARMPDGLPLYLLQEGDCRALAASVSCDQDIAGDGAFSLGMIADYMGSLARTARGSIGTCSGRPASWARSSTSRPKRPASARPDRLLLRRSGPRGLRDRRPRLAEPLPLHRRRPRRRHSPDDPAGIRPGA